MVLNVGQDANVQRLFVNLAIAFVPAATLGLLLHKQITHYLFNPVSVAGALVVGGIAILLIERYAGMVRVRAVEEMSWKDALVVGIAQSVSLFPGVSRSGATIMGGMLGGMSRFAATEFSFFLAIPTMFAATGYSLFKEWGNLTAADGPMFVRWADVRGRFRGRFSGWAGGGALFVGVCRPAQFCAVRVLPHRVRWFAASVFSLSSVGGEGRVSGRAGERRAGILVRRVRLAGKIRIDDRRVFRNVDAGVCAIVERRKNHGRRIERPTV